MKDIAFDITTREIVMKNNDFALTKNPSQQNGAIVLMSKGANPLNPVLGIGLLPGIINAPSTALTYDMNRWKSQVINDGATLARWEAPVTPKGLAKPEIFISYI